MASFLDNLGKYLSGNLTVGGKKLSPWDPIGTLQTLGGLKQPETAKPSGSSATPKPANVLSPFAPQAKPWPTYQGNSSLLQSRQAQQNVQKVEAGEQAPSKTSGSAAKKLTPPAMGMAAQGAPDAYNSTSKPPAPRENAKGSAFDYWELVRRGLSGQSTQVTVGGVTVDPIKDPFGTLQAVNRYKELQQTPKTSVDAQLTQAQSSASNTQNLQSRARQQSAAQTLLSTQNFLNPLETGGNLIKAVGQLMSGQTQYDETLIQQKETVQGLASKQYAERANSKVKQWDAEPLLQNAPRTAETMQEKLMDMATYDQNAQALRGGPINAQDALWTAGNADNLRFVFMTDGEKARYYSIKYSQGQDNANKYLDDLNPFLNARYSQFYGKAGKDNALLSTLGGFQGGLESVGTGIKQLGSRIMGYQNPVDEMTIEQADRDLAPQLTGWQSTLRNIANTTGYALPAVGVTIATGGAGAAPIAAVMAGSAVSAASAWGNDYRLDRSLGYTDAQAITHANADSAVQFGLNSIPGGVTGKAAGAASKFLSGTPLVKQAAAWLSQLPAAVKALRPIVQTYGTEVAENVLQEAASQAIRNASLGEQNDILTPEGLKQAMEGAAASLAHRAPDYARGYKLAARKEPGTYVRPAGESADGTAMPANPDAMQIPARRGPNNEDAGGPRDHADSAWNMGEQETADAARHGRAEKNTDAGLQEATHMLTNPDGTQSPVRMNLNADGTVLVRDVRGADRTVSFKQLADDVAAGKVDRIADGPTAPTHAFETPDGKQAEVWITENANGTYAVKDALGNTETVPAGLARELMQTGVVAKIPKTADEFLASLPPFEEVNRQSLNSAVKQIVEPYATRQAAETLRRHYEQLQAEAGIKGSANITADTAPPVKPDEGMPLQAERQAEVENAGIGGRMEGKGENLSSKDVKYGLKMSEKQFGKKVGKHAEDFGLDPSSSESRDFVRNKANEIFGKPTEIREGIFRGQGALLPNGSNATGKVRFYIQGRDVVMTDMNNNFITIMKDGINNIYVNKAIKIWP